MRRVAERFERAAKGAALGALSHMVAAKRLVEPDWDARAHRVLYVRHDGIGDMIMATGTLRAIVEAHRGITLDVLTHPANALAIERAPYIRDVIPFRTGRRSTYPGYVLSHVRRARYDAVIDGMMRRRVDGLVQRPAVRSSTIMLMLASGAPYRIGMAGRTNDFIYTLPVTPPAEQSVHHVEYSAALASPFGVHPASADLRPTLYLGLEEVAAAEARWAGTDTRADRTRPPLRLLVNISSAAETRRWPFESYVRAVRQAVGDDPRTHVMVIGAPDDGESVARIAAHLGAEGHVPGLREAFALVGAADLVFTPETSIGHAAAAVGTPVVALVPRGHEMLVPFHARGRILFGEDGTIASVSAERAAAAIDEMVDELDVRPARAGVS